MSWNQTSDIDAWLNNAGRYPLLPAAEVLQITRRIQALPEGDPVRTKLVCKMTRHNLRLVVRFVKSFMRTSHKKWGCSETCDYLQVGAIGLQRAAERFDPERGYSFSTYANHWIRSTVSRYNMKTLTPVSISESVSRQIVYYKRNGHMKAKSDSRIMNKTEVRHVLERAGAAYACDSLNRPMNNVDGTTMIEMLEDKNSGNDFLAFGERLDEAFQQAGVSAMGKEILVSTLIYDETLQSVASRLGISRWDARKEKQKALNQARVHQHLFEAGTL